MLRADMIYSAACVKPNNEYIRHQTFTCVDILIIGSWWGNRREGDPWGDLGVDGWIILGWISRRWDVGIWTGLGWPKIETSGGRL